jgi:hypothetical protein
VIFKNERSKATGRKYARLYVQCIDQYRFQREWTLEFRHKPGDSKACYWESHIYQHPGRRHAVEVGASAAEACIRRFLELCEKYPALLFNREGEHETNRARPRAEGFVSFAEWLHRGAIPSKTMI